MKNPAQGDRVRVRPSISVWSGQEGTIEDVGPVYVRVRFRNGVDIFRPGQLECLSYKADVADYGWGTI